MRVLIENHVKNNGWGEYQNPCSCSYCKSSPSHKKLKYGLNIPKNWKSWNSWWVIKYGEGKYIKWTNSWIK